MKTFFLILFSLPGLLLAQNPIRQFPASNDALDVKVATDSLGNAHALLARNNVNGNTVLNYSFQTVDTWFDIIIDNASGSAQIHGLALVSDEDGNLYASYYKGRSIIFATLEAGTLTWQEEVVLAVNGQATVALREKRRTSLDVIDGKIHLAATVGPTDDPQGKYFHKLIGESWISENLPTNISPESMVLAAGAIPMTSLSLSKRGPVIAYLSGSEFQIIERQETTFGIGGPRISWSTPITIATQTPALAGQQELDLAIENGVLHLLCGGRAPDGTEGALYYRRSVIRILNSPFLIQNYENIARQAGAFSIGSLALSLDPGGTPIASVRVDENNSRYTFYRAIREGNDRWDLTQLYANPTNTAGKTQEADITTDWLSRPIVVSTREVTEARVDLETRLAAREQNFPIAELTDDEDVIGDLAVDATGGVGVVSLKGSTVRFSYRAPSGGRLTDLTLDLNLPTSFREREIQRPRIVSVGQDGLIVAVRTYNRSEPGMVPLFTRNYFTRVFRFQKGELIGEGDLPAILAIEQSPKDTFVVSSFASKAVIVSVNEINGEPSRIHRVDLSGKHTTTEETFLSTWDSVEGLASSSGITLLGKIGNALWLQGPDPFSAQPQSERILENFPGSLASCQLLTTGSSGTVIYENGGGIFIRKDSPISSPVTKKLDDIPGGVEFEVSQTNGLLNLLTYSLGGPSAGRIDQRRYQISNNAYQLLEEATQLSNTAQPILRFDRVGSPAILAVENLETTGIRRLVTSNAGLDPDGNGVPLLLEQAFSSPPTIAVFEENGALFTDTIFTRPRGNSRSSDGLIEAGLFRYRLEQSESLKTFGSNLGGDRLPGWGEITGNSVRDGFRTSQENPSRKRFYRIKVSLR